MALHRQKHRAILVISSLGLIEFISGLSWENRWKIFIYPGLTLLIVMMVSDD